MFSITLKEFSRLHYCLIFKVRRCCFRDSFVNISQLVVYCQHLFLFFSKLFFCLRGSLESYYGLWLFVVSFVVSCRLTTLLSYQSSFTFATLFFTFFYFCNLRHYFLFSSLPLCAFFTHTLFYRFYPFPIIYRRNRYNYLYRFQILLILFILIFLLIYKRCIY